MRTGTALLLLTLCGSATFAAGPAALTRGTAESGGVTLAYEIRGVAPGRPLVVVNGGPGFDHRYLLVGDAWDRLAVSRRVVMYDQRGTGASSRIKEGQPCGLKEQIDDLEALRAHLGLETMDLLGHSWGGYLVMAYAARHPERIAHLVIADSAAPKIQDTLFEFKNFFPEKTEEEDGYAFAVELGDAKAIAADLTIYMTMLFHSPARRDAYLAAFKAADAYQQAVNRAVWNDLQRFDLNPELPKFRFPSLVVTGRYDFNVAPSVAYAIHRAIPGSELAVFEDSGHLPFYEEPEAFVARLTQFLGKP
ncbi:MAG TPA: alpha/beta fold hydrolase [Candidatus Polarisedimenticolaceae bacterium]|nr:alpha/beta fold hydrolase [Candidatus Polarisedimenticolaceae bacterium]